ncbi:hypothetical protein ACQ4PT_049012 [Festuca glaucescens]
MGRRFPELGISSTDCRSMTWLESVALSFTTLANIGTPEEVLLNRTGSMSFSFKVKSDYVWRPISAWNGIFSWFKMSGSGATPTTWLDDFYGFMGQHVSTNPRRAYVNFRDLDISQNVVVDDVSTFDGGEVWGERYFMGNYPRLATVKAAVDPTDYFRNEQSIPPLL